MRSCYLLALCVLLAIGIALTAPQDERAAGEFRAGAAAVDITPAKFPVRVNGMFTERTASRAVDPLFAKAIALDDGASQLVLCVVDSCMLPRELIDRAKDLVATQTGLDTRQMMVSATHTHSAPSAMGCLGSRADPEYAAWLPDKLAEAMVGALKNLQPARIGWASVDDWHNTHNRRWILRADRVANDPFGEATVYANMHPGHLSTNVIGPSGPVDPQLSVLAVQALDGRPLALMANYSQHYFGSPLLSADYYGAFSRQVAEQLAEGSGDGGFVAMMSQGTSGDQMWMDYGAPGSARSVDAYAADVAKSAMAAYAKITWQDQVPLGVVERKLTLNYRVPDPARLAWAQQRVAALGDRLPASQQDIYAKEAVTLDARQQAELKLQAIRIGELSIAALPNEVYAITGLKLRARTPLAAHFNVALANGAVGYIPTPAQHRLGGYSTWPARTAGLEVGAEPQIVETMLGALEEVSARPRRPDRNTHGHYAEAIIAASPLAYWRLDGMGDEVAGNAIAAAPDGHFCGRVVPYLPGAGSGSGCGSEEILRTSSFSGAGQINRAAHFAGGHLEAGLALPAAQSSVVLWFWLGEASGASERHGTLVTLPSGDRLDVRQGADHRATPAFVPQDPDADQATEIANSWPAEDWHFAALVRDGESVRVFIDGQLEAEAKSHSKSPAGAAPIRFGDGLEGKLDEIAVFDRALGAAEVAAFWEQSGIAAQRAQAQAERERAVELAAERAKPPAFAPAYTAAVHALGPAVHAKLDAAPDRLVIEGGVSPSPAAFAAFRAGRIRGATELPGGDYSVSLWFKNALGNDTRPVTAYLFSRGPDGDTQASGDHLGIGGNHQPGLAGRLIVFNGNAAGDLVAGKAVIPPGTWNHVVLVRAGTRVTAYLNGATEPDLDAQLKATAGGAQPFFIGARSDRFAPLEGNLAEFALFGRALSRAEAQQLSHPAAD